MTLLALFTFFGLLLVLDGTVSRRHRKQGFGDTRRPEADRREQQGGSRG